MHSPQAASQATAHAAAAPLLQVEAAAALLHAAPPLPFSVNGLRVCAVFLSNSAAYVVAVLAALRLR